MCLRPKEHEEMVILGREDIIERAEQGIRSDVRAREGERQERGPETPSLWRGGVGQHGYQKVALPHHTLLGHNEGGRSS